MNLPILLPFPTHASLLGKLKVKKQVLDTETVPLGHALLGKGEESAKFLPIVYRQV